MSNFRSRSSEIEPYSAGALADLVVARGTSEGGEGEGLGVAVGGGHAGGGQPVQQGPVLSVLLRVLQRPRHGLLHVIIILRVDPEHI